VKGLLSIFSTFFWVKLIVDLKYKWRGLELKTLETEDFIIKYWDNETKNEPLLLIQAFAAEAQYSWHFQIGALRKDHRLIVPNFIYFGDSSMKGEKSYQIKDQVKAIEELLNHLKIDELIICGASYGGVVGTEFANIHPEKIKKLILTNSPLKYAADEDLDKLLNEFKMKTKGELLVPKDHKQLHALFGISYHNKPKVPSFLFKSIYANLYENIDDKRKLVDESTKELKKLEDREYHFDFPILLIWGRYDRICPLFIGEQLQEHFKPNAELKVIDKTAHMPNYEKTRVYNKILKDFLKES
jgi:pimeloyl-ACP methyl ester carboxylesterase